jgi:putative drug exporter of the RND superfamily
VVYPNWNPKVTETPELIGIVIAFFILLITFSSLIAGLLPILSALIGVAITVTGITALAAVFNIATVSTTVAIMLGLSTGIDYGLFILSRHRSQLLADRSLEESVATAVATAGSSVVFAGATVIVALAGLSVVGIPFLMTMGLVAAGAVAISVLIALTLKPIAVSFAVGVAVDAFVVRLTLVPAVMAIVGKNFWYQPKWFTKYVPDPDIEGATLEKRLAAGQVPVSSAGETTAR